MRKFAIAILILNAIVVAGQRANSIDLANWKLELPTGYSVVYPDILTFEDDDKVQDFLKKQNDGSLLFKAFPSEGTSTAKYTKNILREQLIPGADEKLWTMKEGGVLSAQFTVQEMSKGENGTYHRTLLFQITGKSSNEQMEKLGEERPSSIPLLKVYWQNERIRVQRKILKVKSLEGDNLLRKDSWIDDSGRYLKEKVSFDDCHIEILVSEKQIEVRLNNEESLIYADASLAKWPFGNYFNAGNYLQTKSEGSLATVKFTKLNVSHENILPDKGN